MPFTIENNYINYNNKINKLSNIWTDSVNVRIPKRVIKSSYLVTNFRLILLFSCELLTLYQFGFREHCTPTDPIQMLKGDAQEVFKRKEHLITILLDIVKRYISLYITHIYF